MRFEWNAGLAFVSLRTLGATLLGLLIVAFNVTQAALLASAIVRTLEGEYSQAARCAACIVLLLVARAIAVYGGEIWAHQTGSRVGRQLRHQLLSKLLQLGPGYATDKRTTDIVATLVKGVGAVEGYCARFRPTLWLALLTPLAVLSCIAAFDLGSALGLAAGVVMVPITSALWLAWRMPKSRGIFVAIADFNALLLDSLQGLATLKAFSAEARRRADIAKRAAKLRADAMTILGVSLMRDGLITVISLGTLAAVVCWAAWRAAGGELAVLPLLLIVLLGREVFRPIEKLEKEFHGAWAGKNGLDAIQRFTEEVSPAPEPAVAATLDTAAPLDIVFDDVTFAYPGAQRNVLERASFAVRTGETVALTGTSGAGKSTIAALLLRFFDPQHGCIRIGGVDIRTLSLPRLRSLIAVVSQETHLFPGTIADNLRLAKPDATDEQLEAAAKTANAHEFITGFAHGYATDVGERGLLLSGGQRQRIAIARALLKNAPILLLDEATSSVDASSDRTIQATLSEVIRGRTVIVIAHRSQSLEGAQRVLRVESGVVAQVDKQAAVRVDVAPGLSQLAGS